MKFTFATPEWIVAGAAAIILAFYILRILRRKKWHSSVSLNYSSSDAARFIAQGEETPSKDEPSSVQLRRFLRLLAALCLAAALARPQKITIEELEPVAGVDIMLALDTSASMQAIDFDPLNRMQAAKEIASNFISKRKGDRIGIVAFGGAAVLNCPLTLDHDAAQSFLQQVDIGMTQTEGTAIGSGLMAALSYLKNVPSKSKIVILLTDGRNNAGAADPFTAARLAQSLGIKIYTVGTGRRGGGIFVIQDPIFGTRRVRAPEEEIDEETLIKISEATGGKYFRATEMGELRQIFNEIDKMEKTQVETPKQVHKEDLYVIPLALGLILLTLEAGLSATLLLSVP